MSQARQNGMN